MDYKRLLSQVQKTVASLDISGDDAASVLRVAETIAVNFQGELGITGGRLYERREDEYELIERFGEAREGPVGIFVPADYAPIQEVVDCGVVVMDPDDPRVDPDLEKKLGAIRFAAISVDESDYLLSFNVAPESSRDDIFFSLSIVRQAINQRLRTGRIEALIQEAQLIQQSILPKRPPEFPGFDIFGRTVPAEVVGGDYFDFIGISESILGVAIADATGHGLPAALMVRDIFMGLRMGSDRDFKIVRTLQKLNRIIHRNRLTTKFVSLFYGELETTGTFIYANAGHNPPFLFRGEEIDMLRQGGPVVGPSPDATYTRGYVQIEPGDLLCLYSDGIVEAEDRHGAEFGLDRLTEMVRANRQSTAAEICNAVFEEVDRWSDGAQDDRTVVIIKAGERANPNVRMGSR